MNLRLNKFVLSLCVNTNLFLLLNHRKVAKIESMNIEAVNDPDHYLGHPVNNFLLVKRFLYEWKDIENLVMTDNTKPGKVKAFGKMSSIIK